MSARGAGARVLRGIAGMTLLALGACGGGSGAASVDEGPPVPRLTDVDPDVVAAIQSACAEVRKEPGSGDAWGRLGNRYFVHDFLPEAARCFARAEELDPDRTVWTYRRALCRIDDDPAQAAALLERSLRAFDDHAPAHENYALALLRLGQVDEAIRHYTRASALDPRAPEPETGLGQIHLGRGDLEAARVHLEAALARDGRHAAAHAALAQVYLGLGREAEAKQHAERSRRLPLRSVRNDVYAEPSLPPAGARARTGFARQLERREQLDEAEEQYRAALRGNPDYYGARWGLAKLLARRGRRDEGIELLKEAERRNPALVQVGRDLAKLRDPRFDPGSPSEGEDEGNEDE